MKLISIQDIKENRSFIQGIRWDVTPRIFMSPASAPRGDSAKRIDVTNGYMLYVDLLHDKPALMVMLLKRMMSQNVGCITDVPEDLLREAMHCKGPDCIGGMYPITGRLEEWLKKELGVS